MDYTVRDDSIRGRRHLFTRRPQPDIPCYRVVREDGGIVATYDNESAAKSHAAELRRDTAGITLADYHRQLADNG